MLSSLQKVIEKKNNWLKLPKQKLYVQTEGWTELGMQM